MRNLNDMTDEQLADRYINGDSEAFDILLQRTKDNVFSYIIFIVHNQELANDIFQDTYIKAIVHLQKGRYSSTGKFRSWLIRIAHNAIMDNYRHQRLSSFVDNGEGVDLTEATGDMLMDPSREARYVNEQVFADIRHIMEFLPVNQREVVFMRYFQNLSFKEIAETTGVSINTALGRMRYAILNMRKLARTNNIELRMEGI